jgi:hypothetical protein
MQIVLIVIHLLFFLTGESIFEFDNTPSRLLDSFSIQTHSSCQFCNHSTRRLDSSIQQNCEPLLPTREKLAALADYRQENAPLIFWHIQKAGGTYFSELYDKEFKRRGHDRHSNKHYQRFDETALNIKTWQTSYRNKDFYALFLEPGYRFEGKFPRDYRSSRIGQVLLNWQWREKYNEVWSKYVHVILLREPLDLAMSALRYQFVHMRQSIFDTCLQNGWNANDCMEVLFHIKEDKDYSKASYFTDEQINRIRQQILGNFTINHLSLTGDLEEAKRRLSRFHLIIDLSKQDQADYLISCVLGWRIDHDVKRNKNAEIKAKDVFADLKPKTIERWSQYLTYERQLYGECFMID